MYVVEDPAPEVYEGIVAVSEFREKMGIGVVVACGSMVGVEPVRFPNAPMCNPEDLLYKVVIFGASNGKPLRLDYIKDSLYSAKILVLTSYDLWSVEW